jgi:hypothetical protein
MQYMIINKKNSSHTSKNITTLILQIVYYKILYVYSNVKYVIYNNIIWMVMEMILIYSKINTYN